MFNNTLRNRIAENKTCYGVISPTTDPTVCEYLGLMGLDFISLMENTALSP